MPDRIELSSGPVIKTVASAAPALNDATGSIALRHGGAAGTTLYTKTGTGTSAWIAVQLANTKAGTPADADFAVAPPDGTMVTDTSASKLWLRIGGTWKASVAFT